MFLNSLVETHEKAQAQAAEFENWDAMELIQREEEHFQSQMMKEMLQQEVTDSCPSSP